MSKQGNTKTSLDDEEIPMRFRSQQVTVRTKRVASTPPAQHNGFKSGIAFTATPGLLEIYPVSLQQENAHFEIGFESEVIATLLREEESRLMPDERSGGIPQQFLCRIQQSIPRGIQEAGTPLSIAGALLCDFESRTVVQAYLELIKGFKNNQSALHFDESISISIPIIEK